MVRVLAAVAAIAAAATAALADNVLTLTGETFAAAAKEHDKLVVEFYAPWCGHCKKLEPEYEAAAGLLKDEGITLAKVDATEEGNKELAGKFGVRGFPTLKVFRGSEDAPTEYEGPREKDGIVAYLKKQFGPAVVEVATADEAAKFTAPGEDIAVVGVFPAGGAAADAFRAAAESLRNDAVFAVTSDKALFADVGAEGVVLYRDFDDKVVKYDGTLDKAPIIEWVEKNSVPRLLALDRAPRNKKGLSKVFADKKPKVLGVAAADSKDLPAFQDALIAAGDKHPDVHVLYVDPAENAGALQFFGADAAAAPMVLVHDAANDGKYASGTLAAADVGKWVDDYRAGKIERTIKSEDEPADNSGPVKIVTAKTLKSVVDGGKNVLIEFYAPWCGHCKKLEPIYKELGEAYADEADVVVAKMDATANDVVDDRFDVKGFPTIYFVNAKGEAKTYEGGRTLGDFKTFLEKETGKEGKAAADEGTDKAQDAPKGDGKDEL